MSASEEIYLDTAPSVLPSVLPLSSRARRSSTSSSTSAHSDGAILDDLDEVVGDFDWGGFREQRMEEMRAEAERIGRMQSSLKGRYTEIKNEKELITTSSKEPYVVVHFFHRDFRRCKIMDRHLETLAPSHPSTLFLKADVSNVPWLVDKMDIKVLPCLLLFVGGTAKDKIVGFEGIATVPGKEDEFQTGALQLRLKQSGVLPAPGAPLPTQHTSGSAAPSSNYKLANSNPLGDLDGGRRRIRQGRAGRRGSESDDEGDER